MARLPDRHLNLYELMLLASEELPKENQACISGEERNELEEHLRGCPGCQEWLGQELFLFRMSQRAPMHRTPNSDCPSTQQWMELVAGLRSPIETQEQLDHARICAPCCARLKQVSEQFAEETTDEENSILIRLASATPEWQRNLARRMQAVGSRENTSRFAKSAWTRVPFPRLRIAAVSLILLALLLLGWFAYFRPTLAVNRLLSLAYSEHRSTDLRMVGARYAAVDAFRGTETSEFRPPTVLLEAEFMISKELASKPDDPRWLDAQGRADLIAGNYSSALSSLERAHRYEPDNDLLLTDLASAYFLRAEQLKRAEDYGRAVDMLGQVLAKNPQDEVARFNRAVVEERLLLYEQAVEDWKHYLEIDAQSKWSEEARKRMQDLQEKIDLQKKRSARPLLGPAEFLTWNDEHQKKSSDDSSLRSEQYLELAVREWVPLAFAKPHGHDAREARDALEGLARVMISRHQDYWLSDFLGDLVHTPASRIGLGLLNQSMRSTGLSDYDHARKAALDAVVIFRTSHSQAGELMAEFQSSYADQLAHEVSNCLAEASARADPRANKRYPWLRVQFDLESAACTNLNDETARRLASEALLLARSHHYPSLELRATTFLADLYQYMGDVSSGWHYVTEGLSRYWGGDYPVIRGYSLYAELDYIAETAEEWFLDAQVLQEESKFLSDDPDLAVRALRTYRLANALAMTGDLPAAESHISDARDLFLRSVDGTRKSNLEFEAQVALAKAEVRCSVPLKAIRRLEPLEKEARTLSDKDLAFDYFRNLGLAYFDRGEAVRANQFLTEAVGLAEQSLGRNNDERERLLWCRKTDPVYRAMVQLRLDAPSEAFAQWEWFRSASLRHGLSRTAATVVNTGSSRPEHPLLGRFAPPTDTAVVSYAVLPKGVVAWIFTREGIRQQRLLISPQELDGLAHRFVDHCSRPDSDPAAIVTESRLLYRELLGPLEHSLLPYKHLVIEPDQALWLIPFAALIDQDSVYLSDRYTVSFSPGLEYLSDSPSWQGISERSPILVAGDPAVVGKQPLTDAEEEAKGIARQFRFKRLLLQTDASYSRIAEQMKDFEIFHFSGHAAASPDGVGLLLGGSDVMDAATIRVSDISHLRLVVLSACSSANGGDGSFDDHNSLARLLVGAGVPEVVASRWAINSRATTALMEEFYAQLLTGAEVSVALNEASRKLRRNSEFRHPFYWASFSAFGKS